MSLWRCCSVDLYCMLRLVEVKFYLSMCIFAGSLMEKKKQKSNFTTEEDKWVSFSYSAEMDVVLLMRGLARWSTWWLFMWQPCMSWWHVVFALMSHDHCRWLLAWCCMIVALMLYDYCHCCLDVVWLLLLLPWCCMMQPTCVGDGSLWQQRGLGWDTGKAAAI